MPPYSRLRFLQVCLCILFVPLLLRAEHDFEITEQVEFFLADSCASASCNFYSLHEFHAVYLSERSLETSVFSIGESYYQPVSQIEAEQDGEEVDPEAITFEYSDEDVFISDFKHHKIAFARVLKPGQHIRYRYRRDYRGTEFFPLLHIANLDYTKEYRVVINHPAAIDAGFDIYFPRDPLPYTVDTSQPTRTVLLFSNVGRTLPLPFFPFNTAQAFIRVQLRSAKSELTPSTPAAFTSWYRTLFDQQPPFDEAHSTLLADTIAAATGTREKLARIHDYVRGRIRYIADEHGMHAIVPRTPSTVLDRGYGDCKDRAFLVASLARRYGIEGVHMALVCTNPRPLFSGTHVNQYNHVLCAYRDRDGTLQFFDPTHRYSALGNLPESDIDRPSLILDPADARIVVIPRPGTLPTIEAAVEADITSPATATAVVTLRNSALLSALHAVDELHGMDIENALARIVTPNFHKIAFDNFRLQSRTDTALVFTAEADLSAFIISSPTKKYIPHLPFRTVDNDVFEREKDTFGLYLTFRDNYALRIQLAVEGHKTDAASVAMGDMATTGFTASAAMSGSHLVLNYRYAQHTKVFTGADKQKFISFCRDVLKIKKNMFVLSKAEP